MAERKKPDPDLEGIKNAEHVSFVDRLRANFHPIAARDDLGNVTNPRKEFLQEQANAKKAEAERIARMKKGK